MATFFNQATLSYNGNTVNSNIVTGELVEVISATKTALTDDYTTGDIVSYAVSIINSGTTDFRDLEITDNLGAYTFNETTLVPLTYVDGSVRYFINGDLTAAPTVTAGPPLTISGVTVPAGGNAIIVYSARVNSFAPLGEGSAITNTVTVTGGGLSSDITAEATVPAVTEASLTITKTLNPTTVTDNGELTYTFIIQNTGAQAVTAADDASITDTFDPIIDITGVTLDGTAWTEGTNYTYDETTGVFTTLPGQIVVPAATYAQDPTTGTYIINPGTVTLTVTGTV
ncbi:MAG: hypothetical protein IJE63_05035 [Clostridia bacterium]|nr:hypothetical protein [Clostridia bacterium]MBQ3127534.1 hypothetical protein [Clostridia bacterium]